MTNAQMKFKTRAFLSLTLSLQIALIGLVIADWAGFQIPLFRQVIAFIYLTFIPGLLLINIMGIKIDRIESVLYCIGTSIGLIMFLGFLANLLYPLIGISKPITEFWLIITISFTVIVLYLICYLWGKTHIVYPSFHLNYFFQPALLSLLLLPLATVIGVSLLNWYDNNYLLLILFAILSIIPMWVLYRKDATQEIYPLIIWIISLSLLLQNSLVFTHLGELGDQSFEYYLSKLTVTHGVWDISFAINKNSMLRLSILHPIYSIVSNISLLWEYMIIHPLLISPIPVILYQIYIKNKFAKETAFMASCLFMFVHPFFTILTRSTRTGIAILFLSLLALLMFDERLDERNKVILGIIFSFSLITSHYGTSYIFMLFVTIIAVLALFPSLFKDHPKNFFISYNFALIYIVLALSWYIYTSSSESFVTLIAFGKHLTSSLGEFFSPEYSSTLYVVTHQYDSISLQVLKYLYIIVTLFIFIGFLSQLRRGHTTYIFDKPSRTYTIYSFIFILILLSTFAPFTMFRINRIYMICLILLAPYCIIGFKRVFSSNCYKFFTIFLMLLLLFNTGFVSSTVTKDAVPFNPIIRSHILNHGSDKEKYMLFRQCRSEYDVYSSKWLVENRQKGVIIYGSGSPAHILSNLVSTEYRKVLDGVNEKFAVEEVPYLPIRNNSDIKEGYVYIGEFSIKTGLISPELMPKLGNFDYISFINISDLRLENMNKIYTNCGSTIYYR